jgi:hypothetical protein
MPPKIKEAAANIYMNRLNIGSPWVKSVFVTRDCARPMEFLSAGSHERAEAKKRLLRTDGGLVTIA